MNRVRNNVKRGLIATVAVAASLTAGVLTAAPAQALYGQKDAAPGDFPYFAEFNGICGGAAIDPEWVLTAGHCTSAVQVGTEVRIGWTRQDLPTPITSKVLEVHNGPADVALLRIAPRPNVPTVQLSNQPVPVGGNYTIVAAGEGSNDRLGSADFQVKYQRAVDYIGVGVNANTWSCFGDSGSPNIVRTPEGDRLVAVTFGTDGCGTGKLTYSTTLSTKATWDWIHSLIPARANFESSHSGTYQLRNVKSGQLLDIYGGSTQAGANINQYPSTGGTNQQWTFNTHNGHTRIVSKSSSQVVAVSGGTTNVGQGIIQWTATGGADQDWDFEPTPDGHYTIVNAKSGHLLAVAGGTTNPAERTIQWPATGGDEQKWDPVKTATNQGAGSVAVKAVQGANSNAAIQGVVFTLRDSTGRLVSTFGPTTQNGSASALGLVPGTYALTASDSSTVYDVDPSARSVVVEAGKTANLVAALKTPVTFANEHTGQYLIRNVKSNHLLEIADDNTQLGAPIILGSDNRSTWSFNNHDGHTRIVYKRSSDVVAVNSGSTAAGVGIIQWTPNGGADQDWDIVPTADGHYTIVNAKSGHVLAVSGGLTNPGERTIQWPATGGDDQKWDIIAY